MRLNIWSTALLFFLNLSVVDANEISVMNIKYGYGDIYWGREASTSYPVIYPLYKSESYERFIIQHPDATIADLYYLYYNISESENKKSQEIYDLDVSLTVSQEEYNVLARVVFNNKSNNDYFINKRMLPSYDTAFGAMCSASFLITTENIKLDYLGRSCDFGDYMRDWWLKIGGGEQFSYEVLLNHAYEFLPGGHQYQIGSLEFPVVTEQWFLEKKTYKTMFMILDWRSICPIKTDFPLVLKKRWLCPQYEFEIRKNNLKYILNRLGFNGDGSKEYFLIRTNQVSVYIDANKDTSWYQFMRKTHRNSN